MQLVTARRNMQFGYAIIAAMILDALDYLLAPLFLTPVYGDIFDLIAMGILYKLLGPIALVGAFELVPVADVVPTFTLIVIVAWLYKGSKKALR